MKLVRIFGFSLMLVGFLACSNDDNNSNGTTYTTFTAALNGSNERPDPTPSGATGTATLSFNNSTKKLSMTLNYSGLTPDKGGHIHKGGTEEAGPIILELNITASPIMFESRVLSSVEEADLKNNLYYVNLHTTAYPNGEIRGQILKTSGGGYTGGGGGGGGYGY